MATTASERFVPVSCFIYRSEEAKPCDKWSTFVKIELKETFVDLRKRFAINDYGGFKNRAATNTEEEWIIYKEFLFGSDGKEYELVGRSIFEFTCQ